MHKIITILKSTLNGIEVNSVNAREIHEFLEVKTAFSHWIQRAIERYDFLENEDFIRVNVKNDNNLLGGRPLLDYIVSIDMAKELAMVENNPRGKKVRKYFIEVEKKHNKLPTHLETARLLVETLERQEQLLLENKELERKNNILMHVKKLYTATEIAKELGMKSAIALNKKLSDMGIQYKVNQTWVFYSKYSDLGYESIKQDILDNGTVAYSRKFTQDGRDFILHLFKS